MNNVIIITYIIASIIIILVSIPLILNKVKPNTLYGFRTFKTLSNKEILYKANKFSGIALLTSSTITIVSVIFLRYIIGLNEISIVYVCAFLLPLILSTAISLLYVNKL